MAELNDFWEVVGSRHDGTTLLLLVGDRGGQPELLAGQEVRILTDAGDIIPSVVTEVSRWQESLREQFDIPPVEPVAVSRWWNSSAETYLPERPAPTHVVRLRGVAHTAARVVALTPLPLRNQPERWLTLLTMFTADGAQRPVYGPRSIVWSMDGTRLALEEWQEDAVAKSTTDSLLPDRQGEYQVRVRDAQTGQLLLSIEQLMLFHESRMFCLNQNGTQLAVVSPGVALTDGVGIVVYESPSGREVQRITSCRPLAMWFGEGDTLLVCRDEDAPLRLVRYPAGTVVKTGNMKTDYLVYSDGCEFDEYSESQYLAYSSDGTKLLAGFPNRTWQIWDTARGGILREQNAEWIEHAAFSGDGQRVAIVNDHGKASVYCTTGRHEPQALAVAHVPPQYVALDQTGQMAAGFTRYYNVQEGSWLHTMGRLLSSQLSLWDVQSGQRVAMFSPRRGVAITCMAACGGRLAISFADGTVAIYAFGSDRHRA